MKDKDVDRNTPQMNAGEGGTAFGPSAQDGNCTEEIKGSTAAIFGWIGGKRLLRDRIGEFVPEQDKPLKSREIKYFVEVFGGVAWMLLSKPRWFEYEIYNDANGELVNLFNVMKYHPRELWKEFRLMPDSEAMFEHFKTNKPITDVQRAAACYIKYAHSFSARGDTYAFKPNSMTVLQRKIIALARRLNKVSITNESYEQIIRRYNRPNVFLYLDPPYYGCEDLYDVTITPDDHEKLRDLLRGFSGKWALSYNDHPAIRELYRDFRIETISTRYSALGIEKGKQVDELLVLNY
ncbi:MAG: DNA adenine methylase [Candidatus Latescibacterota bacterium]|jgi:DNA adenine methylase|nr:MAG: DNA adenine methylase [Candidatus Latescibacterota bacterium]